MNIRLNFFKNIGCVVILLNFEGHIYKGVVRLQGHIYNQCIVYSDIQCPLAQNPGDATARAHSSVRTLIKRMTTDYYHTRSLISLSPLQL